MRKNLILSGVLVLAALAVPIAASLWWSGREARSSELGYARTVADEILKRSMEARQEVLHAMDTMAQTGRPVCSEEVIRSMRRILMSGYYLKDLIAFDGGVMCSALGEYFGGLDFGPGQLSGTTGIRIWRGVSLPYAPGLVLNLYERDGWAVALRQDYAVNLPLRDESVAAAVILSSTKLFAQTRGPLDRGWMDRYQSHVSSVVELPDHLLVFEAAPDDNLTSLVALPISKLHERTAELRLTLLPIGVVAGLLLASAVWLASHQRTSLIEQIRVGLKRREFFLRYQPIIDLPSGRCTGAEVLLRWRQADGTLVPPDLFIPVAEQNGLIQAITEYVVDRALHELPALLQVQPRFHLSINFSATDLEPGRAVERLLTRMPELAECGDGSVVVEITERSVTDADVVGPQIERLHAAGVHVALDDFGTGYSSLSVLSRLAFDSMKIDKSFVGAIGTEAAASHMLPHIIDIARTLKLKMVAEGVETESQAAWLREAGVHLAQGWLFGKPMPVEELLDLLKSQD